jgi:hypothetical protein
VSPGGSRSCTTTRGQRATWAMAWRHSTPCAPPIGELSVARRQASPDGSRSCAMTLGQRTASKAQRSAARPTRHDALGARLPALPGTACCCPLPVMRPLRPFRIVWLMSPSHVVQPPLLGRRLQAVELMPHTLTSLYSPEQQVDIVLR